MKTITRKEWNETHKDFKGFTGKQKYLVIWGGTTRGTIRVPVKICNHSERNEDYCEHCETGGYVSKVEAKLKKMAGL